MSTVQDTQPGAVDSPSVQKSTLFLILPKDAPGQVDCYQEQVYHQKWMAWKLRLRLALYTSAALHQSLQSEFASILRLER